MATSLSFAEAVKTRRSIYQLTNKSAVSESRLQELLQNIILHTPSAFNSQTTRLVVLLNQEHARFWTIVSDILHKIVPAEKWESTAQRIAGFKEAFGSILFYEDPAAIKEQQEKVPQYADKVPEWSEHTSAMHQYHAWTVLEAEGFGANLQHYQPLADQQVSEVWNVPAAWTLKAQLVFGVPVEGAREALNKKGSKPIEERLFIHGA